MRVGMSNATDSPAPPAFSSILYRWLVCRALPNPENCRIVQARPRYPAGYRPRVNGYSPGQPTRSKPGTTAPGGGPYTGSTSRPDRVVKSASRIAPGRSGAASAPGPGQRPRPGQPFPTPLPGPGPGTRADSRTSYYLRTSVSPGDPSPAGPTGAAPGPSQVVPGHPQGC